MSIPIHQEIDFKASPEQVYKALTDAKQFSAFSGLPAVAYMIAPVMRGFTNGTEPVTMNMPHYMFYAPNVTDADIGGKPFSHYRSC